MKTKPKDSSIERRRIISRSGLLTFDYIDETKTLAKRKLEEENDIQ